VVTNKEKQTFYLIFVVGATRVLKSRNVATSSPLFAIHRNGSPSMMNRNLRLLVPTLVASSEELPHPSTIGIIGMLGADGRAHVGLLPIIANQDVRRRRSLSIF
jgi:hypothetical protein